MGRSIPRFLLSQVSNAKTKGTFIVHTLDPGFITEVTFNEIRQIDEVTIIKMFETGNYYRQEAQSIVDNQIPDWWKYSGIHQSNDPRDKIISKLSELPFLKDPELPFSVDDARLMIRAVFPTKAATIYKDVDSYGIKHDFERISGLFIPGAAKKYCSNDTVIEAFVKEGYNILSDSSPNACFNISAKEISRFRKISFFVANNKTATI